MAGCGASDTAWDYDEGLEAVDASEEDVAGNRLGNAGFEKPTEQGLDSPRRSRT